MPKVGVSDPSRPCFQPHIPRAWLGLSLDTHIPSTNSKGRRILQSCCSKPAPTAVSLWLSRGHNCCSIVMFRPLGDFIEQTRLKRVYFFFPFLRKADALLCTK